MEMSRSSAEICVLGAGLTGATAALELARAGFEVMLLDQDHQPVNRASLRNEGKIHLGFVFAKDASLATPDLMLEGALSFRRILSRLLGERIDSLSTSTPFTYLVPEDSLVSPADLDERYAAIERLYAEKLRVRPDHDYLGQRPECLFQRIDLRDLSPCFRAEHLIGAFRTEELAIDTFELAQAVRSALAASARITFMSRRKVVAVERRAGRFRVVGTSPDGSWQVEAGQIINALWDSRFQIDRTVGIEHSPGWVHRLKYRVIGRIPDRLRGGPSVTMVLGPYGDVVIRPNGTAYFSWYPVGLQGWTHSLSPPESWNEPCKGEVSKQTAVSIAGATLSAIDRWYPGAAESEPVLVDAGVIVAYGQSDVDDPKSGLHNRTRVGVRSLDGYHTVDPGKLTTAPLFGLKAARQVLGLEVPG
jgi:FAD dependent oxidoreductase